ncbi:sulfite exporter TauE/SafE family protein [Nonlabens antarcticus]|uniref:sulfite exporter TauE/SafE family protein n=1 Tax=Nonlabens antarcticus TaxID=392714 RepID=UPI001890E194|nr:sulfite exporter TauE/SafE family protein [Nonlabens antarcticus]
MDINIILILALGIFVGFYVQTVVGFAGSLMALPILLLVMDLPNAIAYISIFYLFSSVFLITKEWHNIDKKMILKLAFTSVIGVILGIIVLTYSKPIVLKKALGVFIIIYVAYASFGKKKVQLSKGGIIGFGVLGGFFSGVFSTGGPLYVMCIENTVKEVKAFRATMIGVLGLVTLTRVPALAVSGILNFSHLKTSLIVFPIFLFAQFLGKRTFKKINEKAFKALLMILLCISGIILIF